LHALHAMAQGGIHDQLGGGFSRYTIDEAWSWPHFEKMLYDNGLLLPAYATAAAATGDRELERVARDTAHYLLTDLQAEHGGFVSATDADAAGIEGAFYTWSFDDLVQALHDVGVDPRPWTAFLGAVPDGNWNGTNVLRRTMTAERMAERLTMTRDGWDREWNRIRSHLLARRAERVPPRTERRILTDWNALTVRGLVRAGQLLDEPAWTAAAAACADFLHQELVDGGHLRHSWRDGRATVDGFLLDHAALALADLELFQATGAQVWFDRGTALAEETHERFHDDHHAGWLQNRAGSDPLLGGQREATDTTDTAVPAGSSVMAEVCLVLAGLTGADRWRARAERGVLVQQEQARTSPLGHGWLLRQLEAVAAGPQEVAILGRPGPDRDALTRTAAGRPRPGTVIVTATADPAGTVPFLAGRGLADGHPMAYVCRQSSCARPVSTAAELAVQLDA
ncbi:MAG: thioredoxin domain-containing protein, partial [Streptomyces sp.]